MAAPMDILAGFFSGAWSTLIELSPSLLLGLLLAGLLHAYLPRGLVERRLRRGSMRGVLEGVLLGVPMPLCSCGVVPTALGLRRQGASLGATVGFLVSTPQTGLDSILVTSALLGWPLALYLVAAALVTGLLGGALVTWWVKDEPPALAARGLAGLELEGRPRALEAVRYAIFDLLAGIDLWIAIGVLVSAALAVLVPPGTLGGHAWAQGLWGMLAVLAVSLPMYVCSTGSVPIAAALIAAGLSPGTAVVFLMAGPTTNAATVGAVGRVLGGRVLAIYLGVVALSSLGLGVLFDSVLAPLSTAGAGAAPHHHAGGGDAAWLGVASAALVLGLLAMLFIRRVLRWRAARRPLPAAGGGSMALRMVVLGMTCPNCTTHVKRALEALPGVRSATVDLASGRVTLEGEPPPEEIIRQAVQQAGYQVAPGKMKIT